MILSFIAHLTVFSFLLFSHSTVGNAYSAGRQYGYSVAPVNLCKSLLPAFAEGNLHFQMHEIAILQTAKPVWRARVWAVHFTVKNDDGLMID